MGQPGGFQTNLSIQEPVADFTQHGIVSDTTLRESNFAMATDGKGVDTRNGSHAFVSGCACVHDELCGAVVGLRQHDGKAGSTGTGDEPFVPSDFPSIVHALCSCLQHRRIRASTRSGLGHGKAGPNLASQQRLQIACLLCG